MAFVNDFGRVFLVFGLAREGEGVLRLSIGDLVDPTRRGMLRKPCDRNLASYAPEPLIGSPDQSRLVPLHILNIVELRCKGVLYIDHNDFPVGLSLVEKGHDAENFDLLDLANVADLLADFANIERIVVTLSLGLGMGLRRVLPGLRSEQSISIDAVRGPNR